jgi:hypothetical protein
MRDNMSSGTNTITMSGNSTGYGLYSGNEVFNLSGYGNTVLGDGANDAVNILGGGLDTVNLNYAGFTGAVTDAINLGSSSFDTITSSHALYGANLNIVGTGGPTTISLANHGGSTNISLGYTGNPTYEHAIGLINAVTLNGDASNTVAFTAGGYANVAIGAAGDNLTGYASSVVFYGAGNVLTGGDEAFTVSNSNGSFTTVNLGNGGNSVNLSGGGNTVSVGNGDNTVSLSGRGNAASFGTGNNMASVMGGSAQLSFAAGDAGANETLTMAHALVRMTGGDENFTIQGGTGAYLYARLGNGNNTVDIGNGRASLVFGNSFDNTATNSFSSAHGGNGLTFNGGTDQITLQDKVGAKGYDAVWLKGTLLGTTLTAHGAFERVMLVADANATINDLSVNGGMSLTLDADKAGGFGQVIVNGLANDALAHINLVNAGAYSITADNTPVGGITLHFDHGTVDLVGLQAVPNNLIS